MDCLVHRGGTGYTPLPARLQIRASPLPRPCSTFLLGLFLGSTSVSWLNPIAMANSHSNGHLEGIRHSLSPPHNRSDPLLPIPAQFGEVVCGMPSRQEGLVPLSAAPLAFTSGAGGSTIGIRHLPSPLQQICVGLPNLDMTSYAHDFSLLVSASSIVEAEARANQLSSSLVTWAGGKQLAIAPQKSSVTLFTSDTHQSRLHPQVQNGDAVAPLNRTPEMMGVTLDTHFIFAPHFLDCVEWASRALNDMKSLAGLNLASRPKLWWPLIRPS